MRLFFAMPFVRPDDLERLVVYVCEHYFPVQMTDREEQAVVDFVRYFDRKWLNKAGNGGGVQYRLEWSVYEVDGHRTNNSLEGQHSEFLELFGLHPTLWKFIDILRRFKQGELHTEQAHEWGTAPSTRARRYRVRETALRNLKDLYNHGQLDSFEYISKVQFFMANMDDRV